MTNSVLGHYSPREKVSLNAFDRSFFERINFSAGMLLPVFCEPVIGGSRVRLDMSSFIRTAKVNTAAFDQIKYCVDFFQVPLTQLCSSWYQNMKTRVLDIHSSAGANIIYNADTGDMSQELAMSLPSCQCGITFGSIFSAWAGDYFPTDSLGSVSTCALDDGGYPKTTGVRRLFDLLNLPYPGINGVFSSSPSPHIIVEPQGNYCNLAFNSFKLNAYQKVYYDHYRNSQYEKNDPFAYNIDKNIYDSSDIGEYEAKKMVELHYVNYYKNYYTNIYPSLNINAYASDGKSAPIGFELPDTVLGLWASQNRPYSAYIVNGTNITGGSGVKAGQNNTTAQAGAFDTVQQIRAAFALDRLSRMQAYNPQHVNPQLQARFGFTSDSIAKQESKYLGSFDTDIVIGEVTATATTGDGLHTSQLGEIGGKGIGARRKGRELEFEVHDDSIIIGIGYAIPRMAIDANGIDPWSLKLEPREFFTKEYENLGMQPLSFYEICGMTEEQEINSQDQGITNNTILGYQPRYSEYKIGKDRNFGLFKSGRLLSPFVTHQFGKYLEGDTEVPFASSYFNGHGVDHRFFKVTPADLDPIFAESYIGIEETDQFFGQLDFTFKVLQNMSVHGEPGSIMV